MSMTRKLFILMAITLAAATVATAATAFAEDEPLWKRKRGIGENVSTTIKAHSDAVQQTKVRNLPKPQDYDSHVVPVAKKPVIPKIP